MPYVRSRARRSEQFLFRNSSALEVGLEDETPWLRRLTFADQRARPKFSDDNLATPRRRVDTRNKGHGLNRAEEVLGCKLLKSNEAETEAVEIRLSVEVVPRGAIRFQ